MQTPNYTRAEAEALVGARFETLVEWDRVVRGTRGQVIWASGGTIWAAQTPYESYEVVIAWDRENADPGLARQGRFTKFQIQKYMRAVAP